MSPSPALTRIVEHPFASLMQGGRLDSYQETGSEVILELQGLQTVSSELFEREGKIIEKVTCVHIPLKLHFTKVTPLKRADFFTKLAEYPSDDPSRIIFYFHSWQQPDMADVFYVFKLREPIGASMNFLAGDVTYEESAKSEPFTLERDWSPAPPMPAGEVPQPKELHNAFGGDPVKVKINDVVQEQRLFVGGLEQQPNTRPPQINAVLNIGEQPSLWVKGTEIHPDDRVVEKGEGSLGMSAEEIRAEANWVIEHLNKDEHVLVHCVAGMNRSTTICTAVVMLLEGLTADDALKRVREAHPWAKPDSYHWLALRWLEKNNNKVEGKP